MLATSANYKEIHYDVVRDVMVLQVNTREITFVRVTQKQFKPDPLDLLTKAATEQQAHLASAGHHTLTGLDPDIDQDRAPKNLRTPCPGRIGRSGQKLSTRSTEASRTATHLPSSSHPKEQGS
jgi:hypothetical protein